MVSDQTQIRITTNMADRKYDIIIYGASGFTGGLVAEYFTKNVDLPKEKWAIAGRNVGKLETVKRNLADIDSKVSNIGVIEADSNYFGTLVEMTQQCKVVITTVGPYRLYGEPLVKACIETGTHYVDITGEPNFVKDILVKLNQKAEENNALIVNCCGFDSIPADLGAYYAASQFKDEPITVKAYVKTKGTFSGGTWASALQAMAEGDIKMDYSAAKKSKRKSYNINKQIHFDKKINEWVVPMPVIDPWMVQRSSDYLPDHYGANFQYGQYLGIKNVVQLAGLLGGVGMVFIGAQFKPTRELLLNFRKSGDGPTPEQRANGFFELTFHAESPSKKIIAKVSGRDPGYTETSVMLSESALTILEHYDNLPFKGGVITPAAALGDFLIQKLIRAGIKFEVETVS